MTSYIIYVSVCKFWYSQNLRTSLLQVLQDNCTLQGNLVVLVIDVGSVMGVRRGRTLAIWLAKGRFIGTLMGLAVTWLKEQIYGNQQGTLVVTAKKPSISHLLVQGVLELHKSTVLPKPSAQFSLTSQTLMGSLGDLEKLLLSSWPNKTLLLIPSHLRSPHVGVFFSLHMASRQRVHCALDCGGIGFWPTAVELSYICVFVYCLTLLLRGISSLKPAHVLESCHGRARWSFLLSFLLVC